MAALTIGILGGTFDPIHNGHLELARYAQSDLGLAKVLWIPTGRSWRKADQPISDAKHRLAMTELAIAGEPSWETSEIEIQRKGPTYTVDTLEALEAGPEYTLILGQDALEDLPNWHQPERLISLAKLAVAVRGESRQDSSELDQILPGLSKRVVWLDMPLIPFSATQVRRLAEDGTPISGFVPDAVEAYIKKHHLYGAP